MTAREMTPATCASAASAAVRDLNHLTQDTDAYEQPADAAAVLAALSELASRVPQALLQAGRYLEREALFGQLAVDGGGDAGDVVAGIRTVVSAARSHAARLAATLDEAHQLAATLAALDVHYPGPGGSGGGTAPR